VQAKDAIKSALNSTQNMLGMYLADLSDADLLVRPAPGANHIAWQLGHLINSEGRFLGTLPGAQVPALPAGFAEAHNKAAAANDGPTGFRTKAEYLNLFGQVREATLTALANLPEADLERPTQGDIARMAPTLGALFFLMANHQMMHTGQFTVVRRKLGKPVLF